MKRPQIPERVATVCQQPEALLLVSISGGKDSQAMLATVLREHCLRRWKCRVGAVHADLGPEVEWPESLPHCRALCADLGIELHVVAYAGGLLGRIEKRLVTIDAKETAKKPPFWPSPSQRYCTSDTKRGPIDKLVKALVPNGGMVVQAMGLRAEESDARAQQLPCFQMTQQRMASRFAVGWHPILDWTLDDVWAACGTDSGSLAARRALYAAEEKDRALEGWPAHPAYVRGNSRVSCVYCIMGSKNDLRTGYREHPEMRAPLVALERRSGCTFRKGKSIVELTEG